MNEQEFLERAYANPHDDSQEFLEAVAANTKRQQMLDEIQAMDIGLKSCLKSVAAPAGLKRKIARHSRFGLPERAGDHI